MTNLTKKIVAIITGLTFAAMLFPVVPVQAVTAEELQEQIDALMDQLADLQDQLAELTGEEEEVECSCTFTRNLYPGVARGDDVKCLQEYLNDSGHTLAESGAGSPGSETTYFGSLTRAAVKAWQDANDVEYGDWWGYFGPISQAKYDEICAVGEEEEEEEEVAEGLTVALADDTPATAVIPDESLYNPLLKVSFTAEEGSATVTGITVTRGGLISNTYIEGVSVWDEDGNRLGNIITALTADGEATIDFGTNDLVVGDGETKSLTVKVNIGNANSGTVNFSVVSASDISVAEDVTINGTFPLNGNLMSIVDGSTSLGNVYVTAQTVGGLASTSIATVAGNLKVGDTNVIVAKFRFDQNNSKEAIEIEQVVLYVGGTINEAKDILNWQLVAPDGTVLATAEKPVDRFVTFDLDPIYTISKGLSKDLSVQVDVADGSTHYFVVHVQNDYDVMIKGATTEAYVKPLGASGATFSDTYNENSYFKVQEGTLTISKASGCPSGQVSPGDQNIVLAKFDLRAAGEKLELRKMGIYVKVNATSSGHALTGTLKVQDADTADTYLSISADTASLQNTTAVGYSLLIYQNLSTYITIESGETKTLNVIGTIPSNATTTDTYEVAIGKFYAKRYSSTDYVILPNETQAYSANELGVGGVSLSVNKNAAFSGVRVAKGTSNARIGEFVLGASSADDIRVSTIKVQVSTTTGIQNLYLAKEDGTQVGSTVGTLTSTGDTFTTNFTISKSTSEILKVFANITASAATGTVTSSITASGISGYGISSAKSLSSTPASAEISNSVTVGTPTLTIKKSAAAPVPEIVVAGESGVTLNSIEFEAAFEDLSLKAITLQLTTASSTLWSYATSVAANISKVYLYDGDTLLNTGGTPLANGLAGIAGISVTLPAEQTKRLTVKTDITGSGTLTSKSVGGIQVASTSVTYLSVYSSSGILSASDITLTGSASSSMFLFTDAAPTVTDAYTGFLIKTPNSSDEIARFTIGNSGARAITLTEIDIYVAASGWASDDTGTVTSFKLYDVSGTKLADEAGSRSLSTSTTATTTVFSTFTSTQEITAGGSKTFVLKANTSSIRGGLGAGEYAYLSSNVAGERGYDSSDVSGSDELYWKDGKITYKYTPSGGNEISDLNASDSVDISGPTIKY